MEADKARKYGCNCRVERTAPEEFFGDPDFLMLPRTAGAPVSRPGADETTEENHRQ